MSVLFKHFETDISDNLDFFQKFAKSSSQASVLRHDVATQKTRVCMPKKMNYSVVFLISLYTAFHLLLEIKLYEDY